MKKLISLFTAIVIIFTLSFSVYASELPVVQANPSDVKEVFTMEETIALLVSSKVTYKVVYSNSTVKSGTLTPVYLPEKDSTYKDYRAFFEFPIDVSSGYAIKSINFVFELPFTVKKLNMLQFAVSPVVFTAGSSVVSDEFYRSFNFTYQLDNGSQVVSTLSTNVYSTSLDDNIRTVLRSNVSYGAHYLGGNNIIYSYKSSDSTVRFGSANYDFRNVLQASTPTDVTSFGFTWSGNGSNSFHEQELIGFVFAPMIIYYSNDGGGFVRPDNPDNPDNPGGGSGSTSGEYAQQLDKIYDELVKQGTIQSQQNQQIIAQNDKVIEQNQQVIDNQDVIKGQIDTITTPDEQTKQDVTDFETQVDENDKKLDDVAEGIKIEVPDIETELDTSAIDEALTDDNFKNMFSGIWGHTRLISIFIVSFIVSIFGVVLRGKRT